MSCMNQNQLRVCHFLISSADFFSIHHVAFAAMELNWGWYSWPASFFFLLLFYLFFNIFFFFGISRATAQWSDVFCILLDAILVFQ